MHQQSDRKKIWLIYLWIIEWGLKLNKQNINGRQICFCCACTEPKRQFGFNCAFNTQYLSQLFVCSRFDESQIKGIKTEKEPMSGNNTCIPGIALEIIFYRIRDTHLRSTVLGAKFKKVQFQIIDFVVIFKFKP